MPDTSHRTRALLDKDALTHGVLLERLTIADPTRRPSTREILVTNLEQRIIHHSPTGFEWGYGGSGPADLALNILALFVPVAADGREPVPCWHGQCSQFAWDFHQEFKRDYIAPLPREGGRIDADFIRIWIAGRWPWKPGTREPAYDGPVDLAEPTPAE